MKGVDLCVAKNGEDHHTSTFYLMRRNQNRSIVIRRGQSFEIDLVLTRPYDPSRDAISFIFYVAGTYVLKIGFGTFLYMTGG